MIMKLSKLAIGLAAICAFSGQAMATTQTYSLGALGAPSSRGIFDQEMTIGAFTDNWTFSVPTSSFSSSITTATLGSFWNIDGLTATLIQTTTPGGTAGTTLENSTSFGTAGVVSTAFVSPINLAAGDYNLQITGIVTGTGGGTYGGGINVSPVPEPSESALLLSGIGLMGFIAVRRRKSA